MLKRNLFYVLLVLAGLAAVYGYWAWQLDPYLLGTVESRLHPVSAREGGRIGEILVTTGSRVVTGQTLVRLDVSDLIAERDQLRKQLVSLETILAADRQRHALEYELLRLRLSQQSASVQSALAELNALNREIQILEEAEEAGLGRGRDLARLIIRRDALSQSVAWQSGVQQSALGGQRMRRVPRADSLIARFAVTGKVDAHHPRHHLFPTDFPIPIGVHQGEEIGKEHHLGFFGIFGWGLRRRRQFCPRWRCQYQFRRRRHRLGNRGSRGHAYQAQSEDEFRHWGSLL